MSNLSMVRSWEICWIVWCLKGSSCSAQTSYSYVRLFTTELNILLVIAGYQNHMYLLVWSPWYLTFIVICFQKMKFDQSVCFLLRILIYFYGQDDIKIKAAVVIFLFYDCCIMIYHRDKWWFWGVKLTDNSETQGFHAAILLSQCLCFASPDNKACKPQQVVLFACVICWEQSIDPINIFSGATRVTDLGSLWHIVHVKQLQLRVSWKLNCPCSYEHLITQYDPTAETMPTCNCSSVRHLPGFMAQLLLNFSIWIAKRESSLLVRFFHFTIKQLSKASSREALLLKSFPGGGSDKLLQQHDQRIIVTW